MQSTLCLALPPILLACGTTQVGAQTLLHEFQGESVSDLFGMSIGARGDLNGDGHPDIVAGGYRNVGLQGVVRVFSGADGSELLRIDGAPNQGLGSAVDFAGDFDGDGFDDVVAGSLWGASTRVYSGATGLELAVLPGSSFSVWGIGDHDGNGFDDVLVNETVFSGPAGAAVISFPAGDFYRPAGDVNGDGTQDVIAMRTMSTPFRVRVYSGIDASLLIDIPLAQEFHGAGPVGDVNADGSGDFAIDLSGPLGTPLIEVHSGADGSLLYLVPDLGTNIAFSPQRTIDPAGDIDGDGHDDFIAAGEPTAALISGRTGCVIARFESVETQGYVVAFAGDTDLDGKPDFVLGDLLFHFPDFGGRVGLFSYDGAIGSKYCIATANSTGDPALMIASGSTSVSANNLTLSAGPIAAGQPGLFYYGPAQSQLPFGNGFRCVAPGATGVFRLPVAVTGSGGCLSHELDMNAPPGPAGLITAGSTWNFQAWYRDPAGGGSSFDLSDGLEIDFTP